MKEIADFKHYLIKLADVFYVSSKFEMQLESNALLVLFVIMLMLSRR